VGNRFDHIEEIEADARGRLRRALAVDRRREAFNGRQQHFGIGMPVAFGILG